MGDDPAMNFYELLEVHPKASAEVIRAAYKSLMQRHHPDKNPGNSAVAERAALVVQAYEVLSDPARRAAYDAELAAPKAAPSAPWHTTEPAATALRGRVRRPVQRRDNRMFWGACLIVGVIAVSWLAMRSLQKAAPVAAAPAVTAAVPDAPREPAAKTPAAGAAPVATPSRDMPAFATNLAVKLRNPARPWEETGRVLSIPVVGLRVGSVDPEGAIRHLGNTREQLTVQLKESLADLRLDDLLATDAQAELARRIAAILNEAAGTQRAPSLPPGVAGIPVGGGDPGERYGVVEVVLPEGFAVR